MFNSTQKYRVVCVRQAVEFLLHLLQDFCGGAVLRFAVVDLIQCCIENLLRKNETLTESALQIDIYSTHSGLICFHYFRVSKAGAPSLIILLLLMANGHKQQKSR